MRALHLKLRNFVAGKQCSGCARSEAWAIWGSFWTRGPTLVKVHAIKSAKSVNAFHRLLASRTIIFVGPLLQGTYGNADFWSVKVRHGPDKAALRSQGRLCSRISSMLGLALESRYQNQQAILFILLPCYGITTKVSCQQPKQGHPSPNFLIP